MTISYINGEFLNEESSFVSIKNRGLRFGDGVFETISFYNKNPYLFPEHLSRLLLGLKAIKINFDEGKITLPLIKELISKNSLSEGLVRIMVTRGQGSHGYMPTYESEPTIIIEVMPKPDMKTTEAKLMKSTYSKVSAAALPVQYKLMQGLNSVLAKIEASEHNCFEAIMLNEREQIAEVSAGNIFFVIDNVLHTPSIESGCLSGTTRNNIIKLLNGNVAEGEYKFDVLDEASEVFITNTSWNVLPVTSIIGSKFTPSSNEYVSKLKALIQADIKAKCY